MRTTVLARTLPVPESPLASWRPGDSAPDVGAVAYRCQDRWRRRPPRPCTVWVATERAARLFGGVRRGELRQPAQATHDLGVAAVWLRLREVSPEWAAAWRGEDLLAHTRHHVGRWTEWVAARPLWVRAVLALLTAAFVYGVVVVVLHLTGVPGWVPGWVPLWR